MSEVRFTSPERSFYSKKGYLLYKMDEGIDYDIPPDMIKEIHISKNSNENWSFNISIYDKENDRYITAECHCDFSLEGKLIPFKGHNGENILFQIVTPEGEEI